MGLGYKSEYNQTSTFDGNLLVEGGKKPTYEIAVKVK